MPRAGSWWLVVLRQPGGSRGDGVFRPGVWAAVPLDHLARTFFPLPAAAVLGGTASPLRGKSSAPQDLSHRFSSQGDSLPFPEEFGEMGVIGVRVSLRMEQDDAGAGVLVQRVGGRPPAVPVDQPLSVFMSEPCFEALGVPVARPDQRRRYHQGHSLFRNLPKHSLSAGTLYYFHDDSPLHGHPLHVGDIFPWQIEGT